MRNYSIARHRKPFITFVLWEGMSYLPDNYRILFQDIINLLEKLQTDREFLQRFVEDPAKVAKSSFSSFKDIPTEQLAKVFEEHKRRMDRQLEPTNLELQSPMASILDFVRGLMEQAFTKAMSGGSHHQHRSMNSPPE